MCCWGFQTYRNRQWCLVVNQLTTTKILTFWSISLFNHHIKLLHTYSGTLTLIALGNINNFRQIGETFITFFTSIKYVTLLPFMILIFTHFFLSCQIYSLIFHYIYIHTLRVTRLSHLHKPLLLILLLLTFRYFILRFALQV